MLRQPQCLSWNEYTRKLAQRKQAIHAWEIQYMKQHTHTREDAQIRKQFRITWVLFTYTIRCSADTKHFWDTSWHCPDTCADLVQSVLTTAAHTHSVGYWPTDNKWQSPGLHLATTEWSVQFSVPVPLEWLEVTISPLHTVSGNFLFL